jgi:quercetin dioxygenase-like cupin family protein
MTDLSGLLQGATGDGVHWALEGPGELNVSLVHLDAGHAIGAHVNDAVDVVVVVLAGAGRLSVGEREVALRPQVVAAVARGMRRGLSAAADQSVDYLSIHRRRGPLGIGPRRPSVEAVDEGGDPACWAHEFEGSEGY